MSRETWEQLCERLDKVPKSGPERYRWYRLNFETWLAKQAASRERDIEREESEDDN